MRLATHDVLFVATYLMINAVGRHVINVVGRHVINVVGRLAGPR
jgi:hypothetical protein